LAGKSDDPLAEDATTAELAVSQQAAPSTQPTFTANPADIGFGRMDLHEPAILTPSSPLVQAAHETVSKFALLRSHVDRMLQQEKVKLAAYCCTDGNVLGSASALFATWDKYPRTTQTDLHFIEQPAPYREAASPGSLHLHVDASGNPPVIAFMELFVELLTQSAEPLVAPDDLLSLHNPTGHEAEGKNTLSLNDKEVNNM
jgi:hypothetical protein